MLLHCLNDEYNDDEPVPHDGPDGDAHDALQYDGGGGAGGVLSCALDDGGCGAHAFQDAGLQIHDVHDDERAHPARDALLQDGVYDVHDALQHEQVQKRGESAREFPA